MEIDSYMTPSEAAHCWGIKQETLKNKLKPSINDAKEIENMINQGMIKYFKKPEGQRKEWILTKKAMIMWFGDKNGH